MQFICEINKNILGKYKDKIISRDVILTQERLDSHILVFHKKDYEQLFPYLKEIINNPDYVLDVNRHKDTIIFLKQIGKISKPSRIVLKLALSKDNIYNKNSIITLMKLNDRTWKQTIKNRGDIILTKM